MADACEGVLQLWRARAADKGQAIKFEAADVVEGLDYAHFSYNATIDKVGAWCAAALSPVHKGL